MAKFSLYLIGLFWNNAYFVALSGTKWSRKIYWLLNRFLFIGNRRLSPFSRWMLFRRSHFRLLKKQKTIYFSISFRALWEGTNDEAILFLKCFNPSRFKYSFDNPQDLWEIIIDKKITSFRCTAFAMAVCMSLREVRNERRSNLGF